MKNKFICTTIIASVIFVSYISTGFADEISNAAASITNNPSVETRTNDNNGLTYRVVSVPGEVNPTLISTEYRDNNGKLEPTGYTATVVTNDNGTKTYTVNDKDGNVSTAIQNSDGTWAGNPTAVSAASNMDNATGDIKTITTEKVPGATCECTDTKNNCTKVETRKYECTSGKGLSGFQEVFAMIIRFVVNMVLLSGVLAIVGLGIAWSFAGGDDVKMKSTLKTWAINIIIGLIILFMFRYILTFLAPWVYQ